MSDAASEKAVDRGLESLVAGPSSPPIRRGLWVGGFAVVAFLALGIGWGGTAPLDSAAVALGQIGIDTNRKAVQHLEGGVVARVMVRERDTVTAGQPLVLLDETQPRAKIAQLESQISADQRQLKLIVQEEEMLDALTKKGLVQLPRLLQVSRRRAELDGSIAQASAQLSAVREVLSRTTIRAPIDGTVVGLQTHTAGGVIAAGATLMEIVPSDEPLVVEVRIDPNDVDVVLPGMVAHVRVTPYNYRSHVPIKGDVVWVSADRMTDQRTGQAFYLARIKMDPKAAAAAGAPLYPGMPVEAMINTGSRTAIEYMLGPIYRSFNRAFRED